jgi:hypothetical protein
LTRIRSLILGSVLMGPPRKTTDGDRSGRKKGLSRRIARESPTPERDDVIPLLDA